MQARIVIMPDGEISVFVEEGSLEEGSAAIQRLFARLNVQGVQAQWDGKVEQHRHEDQVPLAHHARHTTQ